VHHTVAVHDGRRLPRCHNGLVASGALRRGPAVLVTAVVVAVAASSLRPWGTEPVWLLVLGRGVPLILLAAGITQWFSGRTVASIAAVLAALSWAGVTWGAASVNRSDALVGIGLLVAPFLVPWLVVQVTELPTSWRPRRATSAVAVAFVGIGLPGLVRALVYEPLLDLDCGPFCGHSPVLLVPNLGLAALLAAIATWTTILLGGYLGLEVLVRLRRLPRGRFRAGAPASLVIGALAALAGAAAVRLVRTAAPPTKLEIGLVLAIDGGACVAIAIAALLVAADRLAARRNLAEVAVLLGAQDEPLALQRILGRAAGDPDLRVGYWIDDVRYVGADGMPLAPEPAGTRRTELTSRGRPVAVVIHSDRSVPSDLLGDTIGPQALLAIQNESLRLQLFGRVAELRSSRRRIVEIGEAERRGLELDLHDGAQQLLLALSFELRRGERAAAGAGIAASEALFGAGRDAAGKILGQLRTLAHGIHPSILSGAGLEEALDGYARAVQPAPTLTFDLPGRLPEVTEAAVYAIVTALVETTPPASAAHVSVRCDGDYVRILAKDRGRAPEYVLDRVGAAGGSITTIGPDLELALPCG
jgi:signal transduction histidine kinase